MADVRIERISIRNFRGIADVDIPVTKNNLLFYGENGSGKSSFIDAIEYLLTGEIERFERRDVKKDQSIPFLKGNAKDSSIRLECFCSGNREVPVVINYPAKKYIADPRLDSWMAQLVAYPPLLRRSQIVGFIEEKGADRLKRLSQIIGLEKLDEIKEVWEGEKKERLATLKSAKSAQAAIAQRLGELTSGLDGTTYFERISRRLMQAGLHPVTSLLDLMGRRDELSRQVSSSDVGRRFQATLDAHSALGELDTALDTFLTGYAQDFMPDWQSFSQQKVNLQNELLRQFLSQGQNLLANASATDACPFCEQPIDRENVELRIKTRVGELEASRTLADKVEVKRKGVHARADESLTLITKLLSIYLNSDGDVMHLRRLQSVLQAFSAHRAENIVTVAYPTSAELAQAIAAMQRTGEAFRRHVRTQLEELQANAGMSSLADTLTWIGQVIENLLELDKADKQVRAAQRAYDHTEKMVGALLKAREQHLTALNQSIAEDFNGFYQMLHPAEGYGDIQLQFETAGRGLGLQANYHGTMSHPLGFYSEGHLDSLGIAVFLAYIRRFSGAKLLILDDVMTSLDSAHRLRLAHLLNEEFADYQIIITTHDRLWMEELQRALTTLQTVQLMWTITDGVTYRELLLERWEEYFKMAVADPCGAVVMCARDFEKFLSIMRFNFALAIPAKYGDQYSIGEMNDAFFEWLEKKKLQHPDQDYSVKWQKLRQWLRTHLVLRNVAGAHYNDWASGLSSAEAQDFVTLIRDLTALFKCPCCQRNWMQYSMESKEVHCKPCTEKRKPNAPHWRTNG